MGWRLDESTLDALVEYERLEASVRRGEIRGGYCELAYIAIAYATFRHLGFDSTESSIFKLLKESIDPLLEFHLGDWWKESSVVAFCQRNRLSEVDTLSEISFCAQYDPEKRNELALDRGLLGSAMLACLWTDNDDALKRICATYSAGMQVDYYGGNIDELYQRVLLLIAARTAGLDSRPYELEIEDIEEKPLKMSLALQSLTEAVFEDDQTALDEELPSSLSIRMRRWEYMDVVDHISLEHSILIEIAARRGLAIPKLSKKRRECVLTKADVQNW